MTQNLPPPAGTPPKGRIFIFPTRANSPFGGSTGVAGREDILDYSFSRTSGTRICSTHICEHYFILEYFYQPSPSLRATPPQAGNQYQPSARANSPFGGGAGVAGREGSPLVEWELFYFSPCHKN